ncbi:MAG: hypothetical protein QOK25_1601 [Thermoleophilaceae bacterium]|nr:hypothetical protein [Thermoleophilaceae bacterium]
MTAGLRPHWPLVATVAAAAVVRITVALTHRPALFIPDSWTYLMHAYSSPHFGGVRPVGYSLALRALSLISGHSLLAVTTLQHLTGIATGVTVYALLIRRRVPRALATLAAGIALLEGYTIGLEQTILPEAFVAIAVFGSAYLLITSRRPSVLVLAGLLLAAAVTMRTAAAFMIPVWIAYAVYRLRRSLTLAAPVAGLVLALVAFAAVNAEKTGHFGWTNSDGWFLYGRVGSIADCTKFSPPSGTRRLCESPGPSNRSPGYFVWDQRSPANRAFGTTDAPGSSTLLRRFGLAVIRGRPLAYAELVSRDLLHYFELNALATPSDHVMTLRGQPATAGPFFNSAVAARYFPGFRPRAHTYASAARAYVSAIHFPGPLLALLLLAPLALIPLRLRGRQLRHAAEVFLLTGGAAAMLVGATATSAFVVRYLMPTLPLFLAGAALALADLRRPASPSSAEPNQRPDQDSNLGPTP